MLINSSPKIFGKPFGKAFDTDAMRWIHEETNRRFYSEPEY